MKELVSASSSHVEVTNAKCWWTFLFVNESCKRSNPPACLLVWIRTWNTTCVHFTCILFYQLMSECRKYFCYHKVLYVFIPVFWLAHRCAYSECVCMHFINVWCLKCLLLHVYKLSVSWCVHVWGSTDQTEEAKDSKQEAWGCAHNPAGGVGMGMWAVCIWL